MGRNFEPGDRVIATENMGSGANKGEKGVVVHMNIHAGLVEVRFESGKRIANVRPHAIAHA